MTRVFVVTLTAATLALVAVPIFAQQQQHQQQHPSMQGGHMPGMMGGMSMQNMTPAQKEFMAAMEKMNKEMMQGMMDPDPGRSFLKQMAAHHKGAIEMSDIALKHAKDQAVRQQAQTTKQQTEKDLEELQSKLAKAQ